MGALILTRRAEETLCVGDEQIIVLGVKGNQMSCVYNDRKSQGSEEASRRRSN